MKVISTNLGQTTTINWQGKEVQTGIYKYPVNQAIVLGLTDVANDAVIDRRYHGGNDKACYLFSASHYDAWKTDYPHLNWQWGMFGENITIDCFDEATIHIGDIYQLGTAVVQVTQPRQPCFKLGVRLQNSEAVKRFIKNEQPGIYIRIIETGTVKPGDNMVLIESKTQNFSLQQVFHLIYHAPAHIEQVKKAIEMPELAESCRRDLTRMQLTFSETT